MSTRLSGRTWSLILAVGAFVRATSYLARPPVDNGLTLIEGTLPYPVWAAFLIVYALGLTAGVLLRHDWLMFTAHVLLLGCTATFACSVVYSALVGGQSWSGAYPLIVVCVLHAERILTVGRNLGRHTDG